MFHLRFTPADISGYTFDFLDVYDKYIIAFEDKNKKGQSVPDHYHILIVTDYGEKSVRDALKTSLKIPKSGRGKNNKHYMLNEDWKDASYVCKYYDIKKSKGYSEKEIMDFAIEGKKKYLSQAGGATNEVRSVEKAPPKLPFQQACIADAAADWYNYKRQCTDNDEHIEITKVCEFVCNAMRKNGKGVNVYLVKELGYAVLYDDLDYKDLILKKVMNNF